MRKIQSFPSSKIRFNGILNLKKCFNVFKFKMPLNLILLDGKLKTLKFKFENIKTLFQINVFISY